MQGIILLSFLCMLCAASSTRAAFANKDRLDQLQDSKISHIKNAPIFGEVDHHHKQSVVATKAKNSDGRRRNLSNHDVLRSLGMSKLKTPLSHHRKRLAVESRHHGRPDDSHMFIIKLPPNPVYYTHTNSKTAHDKNSIEDKNKKVAVDFKSNGKPGRIYHWNLPVLKKMFAGEEAKNHHNPHSRISNDISELIDIKHIPTWSQPWENETVEKSPFRKNDRQHEEHAFKGKSPTYYAPTARPKKSNVHKYFPGNGKPRSFYVIQKSHKPFYQKLIP